MKAIYLFNEASRAAAYGIGTYIKQMVAAFSGKEDTLLTVVELYHDKKEFTIEFNDNTRYIYIPSYQPNYRLKQEEKLDRYYQSVLFLLSPSIDTKADNIFHFNFNQSERIISLLKEKYPLSKTVITIHYLSWCFQLKGNTSYFKQIVSKKESQLASENEKSVWNDFQSCKQLFQTVDQIICLSKYTYKLLHQIYKVDKSKLNVIYNGLQDEALLLEKNECMLKKQNLFFPENAKIVLFVGRLDEIKGVEYIIQAFKGILSEVSNAYLIIAGDGNYNRYLKEADAAWQRIIFTGKLEKVRLYELYQIADIGIMLSFHEQCSYVAMEMLMHGIPLVITDSTGLSEVVEPEKNGYKINLKEKEDQIELPVEECTQYIIKTLQTDKAIWQKKCRQNFKTRYHLDVMHRQVLQLYTTL